MRVMTVRSLVECGDWSVLAMIASRRFGAIVDPSWLEAVGDSLQSLIGPRGYGRTWSDGTILMWIKMGTEFRCGGLAEDPMRFRCNLHIGLLCIEETDEQLRRLRCPEPEEKEQVARSKVFRTTLIPEPIDRVALRVAPKE